VTVATEDARAEALYDTIADILTEHGVDCSTEAAGKIIAAIAKLHEHEMEEAIAAKADVEVDAEIVVPCMDGTENHKFVVSDENENVCYCERCGCIEY
jgi:hypothetical protein